MKRFLAAASLLSMLTACPQVQQFTLGDLSNAGAIAIKGGDAIGGACWTPLSDAFAAVTAPSPNPTSDGLAVVIERARLGAGVEAVASGPCATVIVQGLFQAKTLGF